MLIEDVVLLPAWLNHSQFTLYNKTIEFSYVGRVIPLLLQQGRYKFEAYGASGGCGSSSSTSAKLEDGSDCISSEIVEKYGGNADCKLISSTSGAGGYISGTISFLFPVKLYLYIGGQGKYGRNSQPGGFNGGGSTHYNTNTPAGSGGGATDFRLFSDTLFHRILVAGGGGGSDNANIGDYDAYDDGSGGAGGIPSQGAWQGGVYHPEYSTNSTYGFTFGQGQKGRDGNQEGAGAGGGFFGGFGVPNSNAGVHLLLYILYLQDVHGNCLVRIVLIHFRFFLKLLKIHRKYYIHQLILREDVKNQYKEELVQTLLVHSQKKKLLSCVFLFCWKKIMCMEGIRLSAPIKECGITEDIAIIFRCCWN